MTGTVSLQCLDLKRILSMNFKFEIVILKNMGVLVVNGLQQKR